MKSLNVHQVFLSFFLGLAVLSLLQQTYTFIRVVDAAGWNPQYAATYVSFWFYGFDVPSFLGVFHVQGTYPAIIAIAVCLTGLKLCGLKSFVPVKAVEV